MRRGESRVPLGYLLRQEVPSQNPFVHWYFRRLGYLGRSTSIFPFFCNLSEKIQLTRTRDSCSQSWLSLSQSWLSLSQSWLSCTQSCIRFCIFEMIKGQPFGHLLNYLIRLKTTPIPSMNHRKKSLFYFFLRNLFVVTRKSRTFA